MIKLPSQTSPADLELILEEVRQSIDQSIQLPVQVRLGGAFGFSSVATQVLCTWARLHTGIKQLHLGPAYATDLATRERLASTIHGMAALYLADQVLSGTTTTPRSKALQSIIPHVEAMQRLDFRSTVRGPGAFLCCFERASPDAEFLTGLYAEKRRGTTAHPTVRTNADFANLLTRIFRSSFAGLATRMTEGQIGVLGQLVHQLFKNADVHTVRDVAGIDYRFGLRGISVRPVSIRKPSDVDDYVAGDVSLASYILKRSVVNATTKPKAPSALAETFIELSVFDTGPGLALRWLSKTAGAKSYADFSITQERDAVQECFALHSTTDPTGLVGDGLPLALRALTQLKAFMVLRTGRLALVQDFSSGQHADFAPKHRFGRKRTLREISGASYTICFPVPR